MHHPTNQQQGGYFFQGWRLEGNNDVIQSWFRPSTGQNMLNASGLLGGATMLNAERLLDSEEVATPYAIPNTISPQLTLDGSRPCEAGLVYLDGNVNTLDGTQTLSGVKVDTNGTQTPNLLNHDTLFLPDDVVIFRHSVTLSAVWGDKPLNNALIVTYHANGGEGLVPETQWFTSDDEVTIAGAGSLTKPHRLFDRWRVRQTGEEVYEGQIKVFGTNVDLDALWLILESE